MTTTVEYLVMNEGKTVTMGSYPTLALAEGKVKRRAANANVCKAIIVRRTINEETIG